MFQLEAAEKKSERERTSEKEKGQKGRGESWTLKTMTILAVYLKTVAHLSFLQRLKHAYQVNWSW